ncbi:metallophosphoesterase [Desulfovibrio oxyclinae]|uniref:metallophosphoesterase n=1 Tax=Desulfovibrio oxyclinae TaxID=63560 RepID=UPI000374CB17|nr:metallophosphoesterase [Desulfovibrio oxyclinae]
MGWLVTVVSVAVFITAYLGLRVIRPLPFSAWTKRLLFLLVALLVIGQRFTWVFRFNGYHHELIDGLDLAGYTFLGFVSSFMMMLLARDLLFIVLRIINYLRPKDTRRIFFKEKQRNTRRAWLNATNALILAVAIPLTAYSTHIARGLPGVTEVDIAVSDLPKQLDGYTIAQVTDTHVGPTLKGPWVDQLVDLINAQNPDMIVHTGDMVDGRAWWLRPDVKHFEELEAPHKFFITGNHEYYSHALEWIEEARSLGFTTLVNESEVVEVNGARILVAGVPDSKAGRFYDEHTPKPGKVMDQAGEHDFSLLLAHRPDMIDAADEADYDLQLSGHTHGGQFFPWTFIVGCFNPYVYGLHHHGDTALFVSRGAGYWGPPMRLGAPPEIVLIKLKRK